MLIIAERINASRKTIAHAISTGDRTFIQGEAKAQTLAGAHYIDVNAGTFVGEEADKLKWIVEAVQEVTDLPLSIDSPDHAVIRAMMPLLKKAPMINSITLEPSRIEGILPLVTEYRTKVIALCQAEHEMAETAEGKVSLAGRLVEKLTAAGVPIDNIYIDPLVYPLSTNPNSARATLEAIGGIMKAFPGVHTVCGLTNVSYGLPARTTGQSGVSRGGDHHGVGFGDHRSDGQTSLCNAEGRNTSRRQGRLLHGLHLRLP